MARLPDEQWAMIEDSIDKKRTAASAFKQRTHCGKGGSVKFPSDFMSKKELNAMNGDVKSYRLNAPLSWDEFKELPNDLKVDYIRSLRSKFNVPDNAIAEMFDVSLAKLTLYFKDLKLEMVHNIDIWNKEAFFAWRSGGSSELVKETEPMVESVVETKYEYRPMGWEDFKKFSDSEKVAYIEWIRKTFDAPEVNIASVFGINRATFSKWCNQLGCGVGKSAGRSKRDWDSTEFDAWMNTSDISVDDVEPTVDEPVEEVIEAGPETVEAVKQIVELAKAETKPVAEIVPESRPEPVKPVERPIMAIPTFGELNFDCPADQALNTLAMLLGNKHVQLHVCWDVVEEG